MNELKVFENEEFGSIREITIDNEPWFVGKDVAIALGYKEPRSAVSKKVDISDRGVAEMETPSCKQKMTIINESGLYALIFGSKLESAKRFKHWVTSEILPTIRKTGGYVNNDELFINTYLPFADENTKMLFSSTLQTIRIQNKKIQEQQSKITEQEKEIDLKHNIIKGLTNEIDIYTKRDIINRICRRRSGNYANRYKELYKCFMETYHIDLERRRQNYNDKKTKKKDELTVIGYAEKFDFIDDLFDCCVKLYETEVKEVLDQIIEVQ